MHRDLSTSAISGSQLSFPARVALLFLPLTCIILLTAFFLHRTETTNRLQTVMTQERLKISLQTHMIHRTFDNIMADLIVLSKNSDFKHLGSATSGRIPVQNLSATFEQFHTFKPHYDQIRFMNAAGMEVIRTNKTPDGIEIVRQPALQSKAGRPYFEQAMRLGPGAVYISPLELNMEHGSIQLPINPTIRFSMPLFDNRGKKFGVLALNYRAATLLKQLQSSNPHTGNFMLLNQQGYWLRDEAQGREWGFMYPGRKNLLFRHAYPHMWSLINNSNGGQKLQNGELFTFARVHPLDSIKHRLANNNLPASLLYKAKPENYAWFIISHIPADKLPTMIKAHTNTYITTTAFLIFIWALISYILARDEKIKQHTYRLLAEKDAHIHNIVDAALNGIITINEHGIIQLFNPAACKMFGFEEQEAIGQNISMIVPPPDSDKHDDYIKRFITTEDTHIIGTAREVTAQHKNGSTFPVELFITARRIDGRWLFIGILHDISERKAMEARLTMLATTDGLTGVYNRNYFNNRLIQEFKRARRSKPCRLSLLLMDVDYFKSVNDDYGHPCGDEMLIAIAKKAQDCARETDIVARYGGEEFAIILPDTDGVDALKLGERLRQSVKAMHIEYEGKIVSRTISIGIACLQDKTLTNEDLLLKQADQAMYQAKLEGRNRVVLNRVETMSD